MHANAEGDLVHRDVFMGHELDGFFQADRADEFSDGLVGGTLYFLIEFFAADKQALACEA